MASKKAAKKALKKAQSAAIEADNWRDRDGKARPTPERKAKGQFRLIDGEDAGVTIAVDEESTILDKLRRADLITHDQCEAGHDFAALMMRTRLVSQGRSCLDFSPVGYDGDFEDEQSIRDNETRTRIFAKCRGPWVWPELRRVCVEGRNVSDLASLRDGLDICIKYLG